MRICARWGVLGTVIGEVTGTGRLEMTWHGEPVVDIDPGTAADEGPVYHRPVARAAAQDRLLADDPARLARPSAGPQLRATLLSLLAWPSLADKSWVTEQYDRHVRGNTVLAMPEDAGVLWQFSEAVRGLADGCATLGVPVTGGNVSFYNQTDSEPIHPTPVVGVLGVLADVTRRVPIGLRTEGSTVALLGRTGDEFGGSAWAQVAHGHCGGHPPAVDLAAERALAAVLTAAAAAGLLDAAHDLSEGGLAIALAECCLAGGRGCQVTVTGDVFTQLFSESAARAVVAVRPGRSEALAALAAEHGVPVTDLGVVRGDSLVVTGSFDIS